MAKARARGGLRYEKPALDHTQLVARLIERGLTVPDTARAVRYLRHIGYYRLSPYLIPFRRRTGEDDLRPGTTFDDVLELYVFDRQLRLLVLDALERIEVAVRAAVTDHMSTTYDDPFWYVDRRHFRDGKKHAQLVTMVRDAVERHLARAAEPAADGLVHASALEHYLTKYGKPELPPSWVVIETLTIGQLERLVANLEHRRDRSSVASALGLPEPLLVSWLRTYVRVRNVCAHHGRLWNVGLGVYPALPNAGRVPWLADPTAVSDFPGRRKRLYPVLVSLQSVLATVSPGSTWARRLSELLAAHPNAPLAGMGVPDDWREDEFWSARLSGTELT